MNNLWAAMWPNIFAPSAWTLIGIATSHVFMRRHHNRKFEELKARLDPPGIINVGGKISEKDAEAIRARFLSHYAPKDLT